MRRAQYVSQVAVKDDDVYRLTDAEQDWFIKDLGDKMIQDMRERVKDSRPLQDAVSYWVTGPHADPLQGNIHVHHIAAWFDLDTMAPDAQFRIEALTAGQAEAAPITGGEAVQ